MGEDLLIKKENMSSMCENNKLLSARRHTVDLSIPTIGLLPSVAKYIDTNGDTPHTKKRLSTINSQKRTSIGSFKRLSLVSQDIPSVIQNPRCESQLFFIELDKGLISLGLHVDVDLDDHVVISKVQKRSTAEKHGFLVGDIIVSVNGAPWSPSSFLDSGGRSLTAEQMERRLQLLPRGRIKFQLAPPSCRSLLPRNRERGYRDIQESLNESSGDSQRSTMSRSGSVSPQTSSTASQDDGHKDMSEFRVGWTNDEWLGEEEDDGFVENSDGSGRELSLKGSLDERSNKQFWNYEEGQSLVTKKENDELSMDTNEGMTSLSVEDGESNRLGKYVEHSNAEDELGPKIHSREFPSRVMHNRYLACGDLEQKEVISRSDCSVVLPSPDETCVMFLDETDSSRESDSVILVNSSPISIGTKDMAIPPYPEFTTTSSVDAKVEVKTNLGTSRGVVNLSPDVSSSEIHESVIQVLINMEESFGDGKEPERMEEDIILPTHSSNAKIPLSSTNLSMPVCDDNDLSEEGDFNLHSLKSRRPVRILDNLHDCGVSVSRGSFISQTRLQCVLDTCNELLQALGLELAEILVLLLYLPPGRHAGVLAAKGNRGELLINYVTPYTMWSKLLRLRENDIILYLNGRYGNDISPESVPSLLEVSRAVSEEGGGKRIVVLGRELGENFVTQKLSVPASIQASIQADSSHADGVEILFRKGDTGLGFCIQGGIGSPIGDCPIQIKRLYRVTTDHPDTLQAGDVILKANNVSFNNLSQTEAWNYLKFLPQGIIRFTILRPT